MRTKQINVSIPAEAVPLLKQFDMVCKEMGQSRSETLLELMAECVEAKPPERLDKVSEAEEHASNDPIPEWMI